MTLDKLPGITLEHIDPDPAAIARLPGFRTLTSKPGHHQSMLQSLVKTVGIDTKRLIMSGCTAQTTQRCRLFR